MKLTGAEKSTLAKIGPDAVCFTPASRHYDRGYYLLRGNSEALSGRMVAALIRKGALVRTESTEDKPPPGAEYFKCAFIVKEYVLDEGFTCMCGKPSGQSGWVAAHLNERLTYTCDGCQKQWVLENLWVTEKIKE